MAFQKHNFVKGQILTAAAMNEIEDGIHNIESEIPDSTVSSVNGMTGDVTLDADAVGALPNTTKVPSATSGLTNDSGFITKAVNDLTNYYLKNETYTRDEIDQRIAAIPKFSISVVSTLPTSNISETTIYLVGGGDSGDLYTEYIHVDGAWELLGSQRVDLTGYATETWVTGQLAGYQPKGDYVTKDDLSGEVEDALAQAKESGEFDGADGVGIETVITSKSPNENGEIEIAFKLTDGQIHKFAVKYGADGDDGNGIASAVLNDDYTLTLNFTDGTSYTTPSIRGAKGEDGSDANVTSANITSALGYTPANEETVSQLTEAIGDNQEQLSQLSAEIENLKALPSVTDEDEGKILTVVGGEWAASELPRYSGTYEVTPQAIGNTTLETAQTFVDSDIVVKQIPYYQTSNDSDGDTVYIGTEVEIYGN